MLEELVWNMRLIEFKKCLSELADLIDSLVGLFEHCKNSFKSERLFMLCSLSKIELNLEEGVKNEHNSE